VVGRSAPGGPIEMFALARRRRAGAARASSRRPMIHGETGHVNALDGE